MDARERWQALQARLTAARAAVDAGNRETALAEITAALDLDPHFLAAHSLRDGILTMQDAPLPAGRHGVSVDGIAKLEQRAKRRRVDRRVDAARAAIERQRIKDAEIAIDEVIELDPNLPELRELTAQFDALRRNAAVSHRGPWMAAATVFIVTIFGASWLQDSAPIASRSMEATTPLVAAPTPVVTVTEEISAIGTAGVRVPATAPDAPAEVAPGAVDAPVAEPAVPVHGHAESLEPEQPVNVPIRPAPVQESLVLAPVSMPVPAPVAPTHETVDEGALVRQALQRYRTAYEGLDAQSAHAVWPAVNQAALARAFDGLESQSLTFDACDIRVRGEAATVSCRGSARYVPKVGSREPRIEPRVWNFTLRKTDGDWKIDSVRAER